LMIVIIKRNDPAKLELHVPGTESLGKLSPLPPVTGKV